MITVLSLCKRGSILFSMMAFLWLTVYSQAGEKVAGGEKISLGTTFSIESSILGERRPFLVYLPDNYDPSGDPIAVMYLLDGKGHFLHTAGIVDFLIAQRRIPEMMVVAIPNTKDRTRDLTPVIELDSSAKTGFPSAGGADQMLSFIKDELIPKIDSDYNTNKYRLLVGHSFGGIFSVNALMKAPDLFNAHISISPSMWWDRQNLLTKADSFLQSRDTLDVFYYMTMGNEGGFMLGGAMKLAALFEEKAPENFEWDFELMETETHGSVPHRSTYNGLEAIFKDWYTADFDKLFASGGLEAILNHYQKLSSKFGYDLTPGESELNSFGYDLMFKKAYKKALEIFEENIRRFPGSWNVYDSAAEAYMELNDNEKAIELYRKSIRMNPGNENGVRMLTKLGVEYDPMSTRIELNETEQHKFTGNYLIGSDAFSISLKDGHLIVKGASHPEQLIHAFPDNIFILTPDNVPLSFKFNENAEVTGFEVQTGNGQIVKALKQ